MGIALDDDQKFILTGPFDNGMPDYYIIIKDFNYWVENELEIHTWMDRNLSRGREHQTGMVISIKDEKEAMLFMLKWT